MSDILSDRFINLTFYYNEYYNNNGVVNSPTKKTAILESDAAFQNTRSFTLRTPTHGVKPTINVSYKRVPGEFCYNARIEVGNLYMQINSIWIDTIEMDAGYLTESLFGASAGKAVSGQHVSIAFKVFASYTPQPGPDGITVFECIIANAKDNLFHDQGYAFTYFLNPGVNTVQHTVAVCAEKMGLRAEIHATTKFKELEFSSREIARKTFNKGYDVIGYLQGLLDSLAKRLNKLYTVQTLLFDKMLLVYLQDRQTGAVQYDEPAEGSKKPSSVSSNIVVTRLNMLSSADWNAGVLTTKGPWIPAVRPGSIVEIPIRFYNGGKGLPNTVARIQQQRDVTERYSVITQEVIFSTTERNEMSLLCVPLSLAPINNSKSSPTTSIPTKTIEDFAKEELLPIEIVLEGDSKNASSAEQKAVVSKANKLRKLALNIDDAKIGYYKIQRGDSLSVLGQKGLKDAGSGSYLAQFPDLVCLVNGQERRIKNYHAWYPILAILTYTRFQSGTSDSERFEIDPTIPDNIVEGRYLAYTTATFKELQTALTTKNQILNIYKVCAEYYEQLGKAEWAGAVKDAAYIWENGVAQ